MNNEILLGQSNFGEASEQLMLKELYELASNFYKDLKNLQAFEAWKQNKENETNE